MHWLYTEEETPPNKAAEAMAAMAAMVGAENDLPPNTVLVPEPNMKESQKARIHSMCKLGQSKTSTVYQ
jgi:hypothetical protein